MPDQGVRVRWVVVVVVEDTGGGGTVVVVCSVVVVRVIGAGGSAHPASRAVPASSAASPAVGPKRVVRWIMVSLLRGGGRLVAPVLTRWPATAGPEQERQAQWTVVVLVVFSVVSISPVGAVVVPLV